MNRKKLSRNLAQQLTKIREQRIEQLKKQVASGQYQVNNKVIAKSFFSNSK